MMRILLVIFLAGCATVVRSPAQAECAEGQARMEVRNGEFECRAIPAKPAIVFLLPFANNVEAVCTHASGVGSHAFPNAFYALDLATDYDKPAVIVRASADGQAFLYAGEGGALCPEPQGWPGRTKPDKCGKGWGNAVKILHEGGYYTLYAHLKSFSVKNGQQVKAGDPIGIEGATGLAGHRHLHWSVQQSTHVDWDGTSVPFDFTAKSEDRIQTFTSGVLQCAHANIGQAPWAEQPRFRGTTAP
jgi:hypothetical protein